MMDAVTTAPPALARCVIRGCPWRWRTGPDRRCPHHDGDDHGLAERLGVDLTAAPAGRHDDGAATAIESPSG